MKGHEAPGETRGHCGSRGPRRVSADLGWGGGREGRHPVHLRVTEEQEEDEMEDSGKH